MSNPLAVKIRDLTNEKFDLLNDEDEAAMESYLNAGLDLDAADADAITLFAGNALQEKAANAFVDLAGFLNSDTLTSDQLTELDGIVDNLTPDGTDEQKASLKNLFFGTLQYCLKAKATGKYLDNLRAQIPV